jgi:hypothetical protein
VITLGIDPSATTGAGYAMFDGRRLGNVQAEPNSHMLQLRVHGAAVEGPWVGPMGKVSMWGLGFDAAWRLCEVHAERKFILRPKEWRAQWPSLANAALPGDVIVNKLRRDIIAAGYATPGDVATWTHDMVEAAGIAIALHRLLEYVGPNGKGWRPRKGCEVRRGAGGAGA